MSSYIPPTGYRVPLDLAGEYVTPSGYRVALEFAPSTEPPGDAQYVFPLALDSAAYGSAELIQTRYLTPAGFPSSAVSGGAHIELLTRHISPAPFKTDHYGSHQVWNWDFDVSPQGYRSDLYGKPTIYNLRQYISVPGRVSAAYGTQHIWNSTFQAFPGGIAPPPQTGPNGDRQIPSPWVSFWTRYLTPGGIAVPTNQIATKHVVTPDIQFLDLAARGIPPGPFGVPRYELGNRTVYPISALSMEFGRPNLARIQEIKPLGWPNADVATGLRLDINLQRLFHHSGAADPAGYGETALRNQFENADPLSWQSSEISFPVVFNLDQYLSVQPYMDTNSDPTQWPNYSPLVENKKRYLGPGGFISSRFSVIGNWVWNKAAPIAPDGVYGTEWGPDTSITHRFRYIGPEGWDSFYTTQYTVIYKNAEVLAPQGWDSAQVGTPEQVLNLNRTVRHVFPYGGETVGTAFIAYRVRTIYPRLFYDVPSGFPEVRFNPYPIAPAGIAPPQFGGHTVYEHFTTIHPKSANVHAVPWVGEPIIENRNKTLRVFPSDQSLYGLAKVFNYNTHLTITAGDLMVWGSHLISYRTRTITVAPISVPVFSVTHRIRNVLPDPPSRQLVEPPSVVIGSANNPGIVPSPRLRLATIYPGGIVSAGGYGRPILTRNTLEPAPGMFNPGQFGVPLLSATQYMYPRSAPVSLGWGKPRLTPHTIYAPSADQATQQARTNHPSGTLHQIDRYVGKGIGRPEVSNQHRTIGPVPRHSGWSPTSRFGNPTLTLRRQYMYPTPIRSLRFGLIMFLNVPQFVSFAPPRSGIAPLNAFGQHTVAPPPVVVTPEAKPSGFVATRWGANRIELFNRTVSLQGIPHRGNPQQGLTNPWGLPLIGFPREYRWGGYVLTLWGDAWVSHKNRELPVEGWDSLTLGGDDLGSFADRMHVRRRNPEGGLAGIGPDSVVGNHTVTPFMRDILGRGILSYNSGDYIVKAVAKIEPAGWDSFEAGDIDRWEAGKIKAHGDDLSSVGTPRTRFRVAPTGPSEGVVEQPRVGSLAYPLGIPEIGFAGPSISNPFGCTNRVVAPLPILPQQNVPEPVVNAA